jgi:hypothetical protein
MRLSLGDQVVLRAMGMALDPEDLEDWLGCDLATIEAAKEGADLDLDTLVRLEEGLRAWDKTNEDSRALKAFTARYGKEEQ